MDFLQKYKVLLIAGSLILLAAVFLMFSRELPEKAEKTQVIPDRVEIQDNSTAEAFTEAADEKEASTKKELFMVDVKGSVHRPGVYELWEGCRVKDAVDRAGGLLESADGKQVNLAAVLEDGTAIYIPVKGETVETELSQGTIAAQGSASSDAGKVNLNTAGLEDLQTLPGIGPSKAEAILAYREEKGKFKSEEELKEVSGIGDKTYEKLEDLIQVN
ncbi:helix-hairpin-helix domain-containing protein [Metabacillus sp. KIGAM252]|uniref:Helix-hairpin-helix domain-containing protein n=1 Tax=Metabacillus flavus TaxID=2823519 RepID=A0ABS5LG88_9BACI|nr:helix-hairpin-helix domain-containing protein [Metabacillus flavus]MBS2969767.1 helix-hairpin-helix domain-containing protein [Metabacillus flavus]